MTLYILSLIGVSVFAISGALEAGRKKFDLMGVSVIAIITALGGGTIRDLLLGNYPILWVRDPNYLIVAFVSALVTFFFIYLRTPSRSLLLHADAVGLGLFTISGTQLAQSFGAAPVIQILMGAITGAAGGVLRDVLCAQVPLLFRSSEPLYATAAIIGATVYIVLEAIGCERTAAALTGMAVVVFLREAAMSRDIRLPEFGARSITVSTVGGDKQNGSQ